MFYGQKDSYYLIWPVCGNSTILPRTGQTYCYNEQGIETPYNQCGQDGKLQKGVVWPKPRFQITKEEILDLLTELFWLQKANFKTTPTTWDNALAAVRDLAGKTSQP